MTTPPPPRLTGNTADDLYSILKFMGDLYRSLVSEDQLSDRANRIAAVDVTAISDPGADSKIISRTAKAVPAFSSPPTDGEMEVLRQLVNAGIVVALKTIQAAQKQ